MISGFDSSRCRELDKLIDENSVQVVEQRNIPAHLHNGKEAETVPKFLNDLSRHANLYSRSRDIANERAGLTVLFRNLLECCNLQKLSLYRH